jgi:septal ring-binding cell division protein DamX
MSIAEFLKEPDLEAAAKAAPRQEDPAVKLRKQVFVMFGSIIFFGLVLTFSYVAVRIGSASPKSTPAPVPVAAAVSTPIPAPQPAPPAPTPTVTVPEKPAPKPAPAMTEIASLVKADLPPNRKAADSESTPFRRQELAPKPGETYLQIAAYGPKSLDAYLRILDGQGRHPLVAPGPVENIYRVLVGPFTKKDQMEEARRAIQASGIDPIVRTY